MTKLEFLMQKSAGWAMPKKGKKKPQKPKDCLSCAQSFSADDDDGNMILICVKDNNHHVVVRENDNCKEWKD